MNKLIHIALSEHALIILMGNNEFLFNLFG